MSEICQGDSEMGSRVEGCVREIMGEGGGSL